jgi:hypothetical protein
MCLRGGLELKRVALSKTQTLDDGTEQSLNKSPHEHQSEREGGGSDERARFLVERGRDAGVKAHRFSFGGTGCYARKRNRLFASILPFYVTVHDRKKNKKKPKAKRGCI